MTSVRKPHPDYLEHRCDILKEIRKSKYYNGEMIYKMRNEGVNWYLTMVTEWAQSFNTPICYCPYCGKYLAPAPQNTNTVTYDGRSIDGVE